MYHCWSELGDGRDIRRKMSEFVASLLRAAHALMLATEVSIADRKEIQRYLVCISMIGWVVSAVRSQIQWWLIMILIQALAFAIRSVFVMQ